MRLIRNPGRVAGLWYLLLVLLGPLTLIYIPGKIFVAGNAVATANNIVAHERLFRFGIESNLVAGVVTVMLTMAFYRLFAGVDRQLAALVVILGGVMPALLFFTGAVFDLGALAVLRPANGADFLGVFDPGQRATLAMLLLKLRSAQDTAAELLWGVWLFPLGTLVYRSRFLPALLGWWLLLDGWAYVTLSVISVLWPRYHGTFFKYAQPAFFAEVALMLWLVIRGAQPVEAGSVG
jgi:hypothetical protein